MSTERDDQEKTHQEHAQLITKLPKAGGWFQQHVYLYLLFNGLRLHSNLLGSYSSGSSVLLMRSSNAVILPMASSNSMVSISEYCSMVATIGKNFFGTEFSNFLTIVLSLSVEPRFSFCLLDRTTQVSTTQVNTTKVLPRRFDPRRIVPRSNLLGSYSSGSSVLLMRSSNAVILPMASSNSMVSISEYCSMVATIGKNFFGTEFSNFLTIVLSLSVEPRFSFCLLDRTTQVSTIKVLPRRFDPRRIVPRRDPKDVFVSKFHFMNKLRPKQLPPLSFDQAFELFCEGVSEYGPYWDHVLGFWRASLESPDKILFLKYEEIKKEPEVHVKSFEHLKNLEVNKIGIQRFDFGFEIENRHFFRQGLVGDWKHHMTQEMRERIDRITQEKFKGSGLTIGASTK
ncbi:P-loop containing nucleoside triphosphate hydrolase [Artemisia annua]|uniref:Sulfotransferase n=1 Tax=Artemisia annua TaxID=35608 RepID=A0A2U1MVY9_ARTAN|nr:P-loop containing nucleoside triphosphate hydrolase [Artemisia annua]